MPLYAAGQRIARLYRGATPVSRVYRGAALMHATAAKAESISPIAVVATGSAHSPVNGNAARSFNIGLAQPWDQLIICTGHRSTSAAQTISSILVGGTAAVFGASATQGFQRAEVWSIMKGGSGTASLSITPSGAISNLAVTLIGITGLGSTAIFESTAVTLNTNNHHATFDVPAGGIAVRSLFNVPAALQSASWSGGTEISDQWISDDVSFHYSAGYFVTAEAASAHAFNTTITGNNNSCGVAVRYLNAS